MTAVRVAVAQCAPALGAVARNVAMHREWASRAKAGGAHVVLFPELALTGYYLKDLAADVAVARDGPELAAIRELSRDLDVCTGFVERAADGRVFIAQAYFAAGELRHVHRKVYLPTYGIFDDARFFAPGDRFDVFDGGLGTMGIAICEDFWHMSAPYLLATAGATAILSPSASPGRGIAEGGDLGTAESCRLMNRFYAQYLTTFVVYANRVGHEDGIGFWGGSEIVAPDGSVLARGAEFEEALVVADCDPALAHRERLRNPLLRDERPTLVLQHLAQRLGLPLPD
jgi:NAD+ synthase (glutamine-hydrolysing)